MIAGKYLVIKQSNAAVKVSTVYYKVILQKHIYIVLSASLFSPYVGHLAMVNTI